MSPQLATSLALGSVDFAQLPFQVQDEVHTLLTAMTSIHAADNKSKAIAMEAASLRGKVACSPKTLERKYYKWARRYDWRVLINRAKAPKRGINKGLPEDFLAHWHSLYLTNQRTATAAYRQLIREWMAGKPTPGYPKPPAEYGNTGHPEGWDYTNLMRGRNRPTEFETEAARKGRDYANKHRPNVLTTRVGLEVGQVLMFDDMWHDFKCYVPGQRKASRIISLHALDLFSGCLFASGHKPTLYNETADGKTKREQIGKKEMTFFLAHVFQNHGYRAAGCRLVAEHGTANVSKSVKEALARLSGDKIEVTESGIVDKALVTGMFAGAGKGNFKLKAALESLHNLVHNETADRARFPMQTGSNARLNAPTGLHGADHYTETLIKAIERLGDDEKAAQIQLPPIDVSEAIDLIYQTYDLINHRHEHQLEGWIKAKLTTIEWRLDKAQQWQAQQDLLAMEPLRREAIQALLATDDSLVRNRQLRPIEVYRAGQAKLRRFTIHQLPQIFGEDLGQVRQVASNNHISFNDADIDPETMHFGPYAQDEYGERMLRSGDKFLCYCNPYQPDGLILCDARGGFVGLAPRVQRASQADVESLQRASGRAAHIEKELLIPVIRGQAHLIQANTDMRRNNAAILRNKTPKQDRKAGRLEDFTDSTHVSIGAGHAPADAADEFYD